MSQITGSLVKLAHDEGFASGIAIACGIALNEFGEEVVVQEILQATGLNSRRKMRALNVSKYDLDRLKIAFAQIRESSR